MTGWTDGHPSGVELPRVDPVGLLETPSSFRASARAYSRAVRALAAALILAFLVVGTATTVLTLGAYCLTSHASTPAPIPGAGPRGPA